MVLPDWAWHLLGPTILDPFEPELVNVTSYDLRLGRVIRLQRWQGEEMPDTPAILAQDGAVLFKDPVLHRLFPDRRPFLPGDAVLASTQERFNVPRWVRLQGHLKSSVARAGCNHRSALYIDPGFHGFLTLELDFKVSGFLIPGRRIIQVEAETVLPWKQYRGHYNGQGQAAPNRNPEVAFQPTAFAAEKEE